MALIVCPICSGSGWVCEWTIREQHMVKCTRCNGTGTVKQ